MGFDLRNVRSNGYRDTFWMKDGINKLLTRARVLGHSVTGHLSLAIVRAYVKVSKTAAKLQAKLLFGDESCSTLKEVVSTNSAYEGLCEIRLELPVAFRNTSRDSKKGWPLDRELSGIGEL